MTDAPAQSSLSDGSATKNDVDKQHCHQGSYFLILMIEEAEIYGKTATSPFVTINNAS
jgi:hypothetical protein